MTEEAAIQEIAQIMRESNRLLFITGSGISVDSGLPTYRGIGGLYEGKCTEDGISIEESLSGEMLENNPEITWKHLWEIAHGCRGAKPNRCHEILAKIGQRVDETWILTQNVDSLHRAAGSRHLIEIHGRADATHCMVCGKSADSESLLASRMAEDRSVPFCAVCGGVLRPDVVLFGEPLPPKAMHDLEELARTGVDLVMSLGTSSLFPYITAPMQLAHQLGIPTVEVNLQTTDASEFAQYRLEMDCKDALELIAQQIT